MCVGAAASLQIRLLIKALLRCGEERPLDLVVEGRLSELLSFEFVFCALLVPLKNCGWKKCFYSDNGN